MNSLSAVVRASDDFGVSKLTIHYRVEDLDTGKTKAESFREQLFPLPRVDIPQAVLLRFAELGAVAGDRVVFWAEAEDAYDLEQPAKGRMTRLRRRIASRWCRRKRRLAKLSIRMIGQRSGMTH